ncbi:MAG: hypothetical protein IH897_06900, partial [Planctomycetes bacterium]|nr:hypothetical protein [Planctomycetota bacterium]
LGIRSLNPDTPLSRLNAGTGVESVLGKNDMLITTKAGDEIFVNLDDARTIGDVIDLINTAATDATVALIADLSDTGNGIRLTDSTGGTAALFVANVGLSLAATELGLTGSADPADSELIGRDSNPIRTAGILTALIDLETALRNDDTLAISRAAARIDPQIEDVTRMHGILGAKAKAIQERFAQMEDAGTMAEIFLSEVRDLDFAEAVTQMQSTVTQLQATMQTSGVLLNLSLMDFLR